MLRDNPILPIFKSNKKKWWQLLGKIWPVVCEKTDRKTNRQTKCITYLQKWKISQVTRDDYSEKIET